MRRSLFVLPAVFFFGCAHLHPTPKKDSEITTKLEPTVVIAPEILPSPNPKEIVIRGVSLKNNQFDIPVAVNSRVEFWVDYFTTRGRPHFEKYLERSDLFVPYITPILKQKGMPEDLVYLAMIESGFNNHARSRAKAVGPWQFISGTGKKFGLMVNWWVDERRDTRKSTLAAIEYLKVLYQLFGSWELTIAAYNAGEAKIARAIRRYGVNDFWALSRHRFLKQETRDYVPKVIAAAFIAKNRDLFGFNVSPVAQDKDLATPQVSKKGEITGVDLIEFEIQAPADLLKISKAAELSYQTVKSLNPELLRWCTPPVGELYRIKLPTSVKDRFLANYNHEAFPRKIDFLTYKIKSGETLFKVARHFGIRVDPISELNQIAPKTPLRAGTKILLPMPNDATRSLASLDLRDSPEKRRKAYRSYRVTYKNREGVRVKPLLKNKRDT